MAILPDIGWHFLSVLYLLIFALMFTFYALTRKNGIGLTIISFIINFLMWSTVLIQIEKAFEGSFLYAEEQKYGIIIIAGILWAFNKIILDWIFSNFLKK